MQTLHLVYQTSPVPLRASCSFFRSPRSGKRNRKNLATSRADHVTCPVLPVVLALLRLLLGPVLLGVLVFGSTKRGQGRWTMSRDFEII